MSQLLHRAYCILSDSPHQGIPLWGSEDGRIEQREKLTCFVVETEASADPVGERWSRMDFQNFPN